MGLAALVRCRRVDGLQQGLQGRVSCDTEDGSVANVPA